MSDEQAAGSERTIMSKEPAQVLIEGVPLRDAYISWAAQGGSVQEAWVGGREDTLSRSLRPGGTTEVVIRKGRQQLSVTSAEIRQIVPPRSASGSALRTRPLSPPRSGAPRRARPSPV